MVVAAAMACSGSDGASPQDGGVGDSESSADASSNDKDAGVPSNLRLSALTLSSGVFSPTFAPTTLAYTAAVANGLVPVPFTVTATAADATASLTVNGITTLSGNASAPIALSTTMPTPVDITVRASDGTTAHTAVVVNPTSELVYVKASNTTLHPSEQFGTDMALDGDTLAVAANLEGSGATGINGNQADISTTGAGAVYVFTRTGGTWSQQAYVKASNTRQNAFFGSSVALAGNTLVVGAVGDSSNATGVDGNQADTSLSHAGAAYVFTRTGTTWAQQAYVKASNPGVGARFGAELVLAGDTFVVGAIGEASNATGINGNQSDTSATLAGAAYVFTRAGTTWSQQAYLKASNTRGIAFFGAVAALQGDTLVVGSFGETSNASGVNGDQSDTSAVYAGAAYVFTRTGTTWAQQAYIKPSNTRANGRFGIGVALDGNTLAVGANGETSNATGANGNQSDTSVINAGAAYVFTRTGTTWAQTAYLKASNPRLNAAFGAGMALSGDTLVVGSNGETSNATGINGNQSDTSVTSAGAAYVFMRTGTTWAQTAYVKAPNPQVNAGFGIHIALSQGLLAISAPDESSNATGINGNPADNSMPNAGAVYLLR